MKSRIKDHFRIDLVAAAANLAKKNTKLVRRVMIIGMVLPSVLMVLVGLDHLLWRHATPGMNWLPDEQDVRYWGGSALAIMVISAVLILHAFKMQISYDSIGQMIGINAWAGGLVAAWIMMLNAFYPEYWPTSGIISWWYG